MIELEAPTPRPGRRKAVVAGITAVAVLAGLAALVRPGGAGSGQLALQTGGAGQASGERSAMFSGAPAADSALSVYPDYGWGGLEYRLDGPLPDLPDTAVAWRLTTPDLDREAVERMVSGLSLSGEPVRRDGGWALETSEGSFSVFPGEGWSINFSRSASEDRSTSEDRSGPRKFGSAYAERVARGVLARMGVLTGEWRAQLYETETVVDYVCAEPAKLRDLEAIRGPESPDSPVSSDSAVSPRKAPDSSVQPDLAPPPDPISCPPPSPAMPAQSVSLYPVLGGTRTDWQGWTVTVGPDGHIESLYGTWANFKTVGELKLRGVKAAFEELKDGSKGAFPMPLGVEPAIGAMPQPAPADTPSAPWRTTSDSETVSTTAAAEPAVGAPEPFMYPQFACPDRPLGECAQPKPLVVTITGVESALIPMPAYVDGSYNLHLVPAYRFTGRPENPNAFPKIEGGGEPYETTVLALHPDAIAPPPQVDNRPTAPAPGGGGGSSGSSGGGVAPGYPGDVIEPLPAIDPAPEG